LNPVLKEVIRTGSCKSPEGGTIKIQFGVSPEEGRFLQSIISELKPVVSLEVGLAYGISALFICDALPKTDRTRHIVIDPYQLVGPSWGDSWKGIGLSNLKDAGFENIVEFHDLPSHIALPKLESQGVKIDFAFIDGWHTFDHTLVDFFYIDRMLKVGGVVAIDDADWPAIRKVCRFIATNLSYTVFRCLANGNSPAKFSLKGRVLRRAANVSAKLRELLKPEFVEPDVAVNLLPGSRCIAFRKESQDSRRWDYHRSF